MTEPKMVNYIRPAYTPEDCFKVLEQIIKKHTNLSFIEATEADHALNSLLVHLGVGIEEVEIKKEEVIETAEKENPKEEEDKNIKKD